MKAIPLISEQGSSDPSLMTLAAAQMSALSVNIVSESDLIELNGLLK